MAAGSTAPPPETSAEAAEATQMPPVAAGWTERDVTFDTPIGTFHGTVTHPIDGATLVPAALIIGGSGPTDRDGNSPLVPGEIGNLTAVARSLASDGIASLRYDKLGSGETGMADLTLVTLPALTAQDYLTVNAEALNFLAGEAVVDATRLSIVGHTGEDGDANLSADMTILVTCSDADIQVECVDVDELTAAAQASGADYGSDLPFSPELESALKAWADTCC